MQNYIEDINRFRLAGPPKWWLQKLWDFDNSLVVVPSRQSCIYRLGQRRKLRLPDHIVNDALFKESDTKMLASYGLIPVTTILATANWSDPYMFVELANRAPWRMGGAAEAIKQVEAQDAKQEMQQQFAQDDMLNWLGKDAWGLYNKKIGTRSHMYIPKTANQVVGGRKSPAIKIK